MVWAAPLNGSSRAWDGQLNNKQSDSGQRNTRPDGTLRDDPKDFAQRRVRADEARERILQLVAEAETEPSSKGVNTHYASKPVCLYDDQYLWKLDLGAEEYAHVGRAGAQFNLIRQGDFTANGVEVVAQSVSEKGNRPGFKIRWLDAPLESVPSFLAARVPLDKERPGKMVERNRQKKRRV